MPAAIFDVNDAQVRESFLRDEFPRALGSLRDDFVGQWGRMRPREMVEHLVWSFRLATGRAATRCFVAPEAAARYKQALYSNRPLPRDTPNPALAGGLPPLEFGSLDEARAALALESQRFLEAPPDGDDEARVHPVLGPLGHEEWHRILYKHVYHHLAQFGLIG